MVVCRNKNSSRIEVLLNSLLYSVYDINYNWRLFIVKLNDNVKFFENIGFIYIMVIYIV